MLAVWPITSRPAFRNGGANGGVPSCASIISIMLSHAAFATRDIEIAGPGLFQREAHKFAAALNARPVIELIAHGNSFDRTQICSSAAAEP